MHYHVAHPDVAKLVETCMVYMYLSGNCDPGMGLNPTDNSGCVTCPAGSYSDVSGPSECQTCPDGQTTAEEGSTLADECLGE